MSKMVLNSFCDKTLSYVYFIVIPFDAINHKGVKLKAGFKYNTKQHMPYDNG